MSIRVATLIDVMHLSVKFHDVDFFSIILSMLDESQSIFWIMFVTSSHPFPFFATSGQTGLAFLSYVGSLGLFPWVI